MVVQGVWGVCVYGYVEYICIHTYLLMTEYMLITFEIYSKKIAIIINIFIILYIRSPELTYLLTEYLFLFTIISPFPWLLENNILFCYYVFDFFRFNICEIMLWERVKGREAWHAAVKGSRRVGHDWVTELQQHAVFVFLCLTCFT